MSDEKIQEFRRRARVAADPAAETRAWVEALRNGRLPAETNALVTRVARGELPRARLALAAYAGEPMALALLGEETAEYAAFIGDLGAVHVAFADEGITYAEVESWLMGLTLWGYDPRLVAGLGFARALLASVSRVIIGRPPQEPGAAYEFAASLRAREELLVLAPALIAAAERAIVSRTPFESDERFSRDYYWWEWERVAHAIAAVLDGLEERRSPSARSLILACENERIRPDDAATAARAAVADFALTPLP